LTYQYPKYNNLGNEKIIPLELKFSHDQHSKDSNILEILDILVKEKGKISFVDDYEPTKQEVLGIMLSQYFEWCGDPLLDVLSYALEDANFHDWNSKFTNFCSSKLKVEVGKN